MPTLCGGLENKRIKRKMEFLAIRATGTAAEVVAGLKGLAAAYPQGATLAEVARAQRLARLGAIVRGQLERLDKRREARHSGQA